MSEIVITLLKVRCDEVTDDFLEGLTDEFGWRICGYGPSGEVVQTVEEIPMKGLEAVEAGSVHEVGRELARIREEASVAQVEFWDQDTFGEDDLLGWIEVRRTDDERLELRAGEWAEDLGGGAFRLGGADGDYTVWLDVRCAPA